MPSARGRYEAAEGRRLVPDRRERQYKHVFENQLDRLLARGVGFDRAMERASEIAARVVNRYRARAARGRTVCRTRGGRTVCRRVRGLELVGRGGSRRAWYPGKRVAGRRYACLRHRRRFRSKAALLRHYRRHYRRHAR